MRARYLITAVVSLLALSGCVSLRDVTSRETGCDPDEITISNEQRDLRGQTWVAYCQGKMHTCSWYTAYNTTQETTQISCTPQENRAVAEGCKFDTQCKGDRVCVSGKCVDPVARPVP